MIDRLKLINKEEKTYENKMKRKRDCVIQIGSQQQQQQKEKYLEYCAFLLDNCLIINYLLFSTESKCVYKSCKLNNSCC